MSKTGPFDGWIANRSPTGVASATSVWWENDGWKFSGMAANMTAPRGEKIYATKDDAILAARFRWKCNQGRPRGKKPTPFATT